MSLSTLKLILLDVLRQQANAKSDYELEQLRAYEVRIRKEIHEVIYGKVGKL